MTRPVTSRQGRIASAPLNDKLQPVWGWKNEQFRDYDGSARHYADG